MRASNGVEAIGGWLLKRNVERFYNLISWVLIVVVWAMVPLQMFTDSWAPNVAMLTAASLCLGLTAGRVIGHVEVVQVALNARPDCAEDDSDEPTFDGVPWSELF